MMGDDERYNATISCSNASMKWRELSRVNMGILTRRSGNRLFSELQGVARAACGSENKKAEAEMCDISASRLSL